MDPIPPMIGVEVAGKGGTPERLDCNHKLEEKLKSLYSLNLIKYIYLFIDKKIYM